MLRILTALNLHFPQAGRSPEEMLSLAEDWAEDFAAFPMPVMEQGGKGLPEKPGLLSDDASDAELLCQCER